MTHQTLKNKEVVPAGGFKYLEKETGIWIKSPSWIELVSAVKNHRKANALPIGLLIERDIETQICSTLPPGHCSYSDETHNRRAAMIGRPTVRQVIDVTRLFFKRLFGNAEHVSVEQATAQARICANCEFNQPPDGCSSCNATERADAVAFALGTRNKETIYHDKLKSCLLCSCDLRAKVFFSPESLSQSSDYPEWCWLHKAVTLPIKVLDSTE